MQPFQRVFTFTLVLGLFSFIPLISPLQIVAQDDIGVVELLATGGAVRAIAADGERLFVAKGSRLVVYDVTGDDPVLGNQPIELTQTHVHDVVVSLAHAGNYVYLGLKHGDVVVIDVSDEIQPTVVGRVTVRVNDEEDKEVEGLAISGTYLYCSLGSDGLQVVDVANPTNLQVGVNVSGNSEWINGIIVQNNRLYSLEQLRNVAPRTLVVRTYSLANPAAPSIEGSADLEESSSGLHLSVDGNFAYVYGEWYNPGVIIVDVSQPANPVRKGTFSDGEFTPVVSVRGDGNRFYAQSSPGYAGEPTRRLMSIDVSDPSNPQKMGEVELVDFQTSHTGPLPLVDNRIFCSFGVGDVAMQTVDVSSPTKPEIGLEFGEPTTFFGQTVIGSMLYRSTADKLLAYDITEPNSPLLLHTYEGDGFSGIQSIEGNENRLFLSRLDGDGMSVVIFDITDPANPKERGSYTPADENHKVVGKGNYLYVITVDGDPWSQYVFPWGLDVVDITNPDAPNRVGRVEGTIRDIIAPAEGNHIYILADQLAGSLSAHSGLVALDVTNPASPAVSSSQQTAGTRGRMTLSGSTVLTVTNNGNVFTPGQFWSVESFDVSNPSAITNLERYDGPSGKDELASDVVVSDDGIVTVGLMGVGLRFFEYDELTNGSREKQSTVLDGIRPAGSYASTGTSSFSNYSTSNWNYIVAKEYTWASVFSYPDNRRNDHRGDGGGTSICYQRKDPDFVLLLTSVWPAIAAKVGATASPSGVSKHQKGSTATLSTNGVPGWNFQQWVGAASGNNPNTTVLMDAHKAAAAVYTPSFGLPTLTVGLASPGQEIHCPPDPSIDPRIKIASVTLSANSETNWRVTSVTLTGEGLGQQKYVKEVILKYNGKEEKFPVPDRNDNPFGTIGFSVNALIPLGTTLTMDVFYSFDIPSKVNDGRYMPCPLGNANVPDYGVSITSGQITAYPDDGSVDFTISPDPSIRFTSQKQIIACVQNVTQGTGFDDLQEAIYAADMKGKDMIKLCPGVFDDNFTIDKSLMLTSLEGVDVTEIKADEGTALSVKGDLPENVDITYLTFTGNESSPAIHVQDAADITITNCLIRNAAQGVLLVNPYNVEVSDNNFDQNISAFQTRSTGGASLNVTDTVRFTDNTVSALVDHPAKAAYGCYILDKNSHYLIKGNLVQLHQKSVGQPFGTYRVGSIGFDFNGVRNGKSVYRVENNIVRNADVGVEMFQSENVQLVSNTIEHCPIGVRMSACGKILMEKNTIHVPYQAIQLSSSEKVRILSNDLSNNYRGWDEKRIINGQGIRISGGVDYTIQKNTIHHCFTGIRVNAARNVRVLQNTFSKNFIAVNGLDCRIYVYGNGLYDHGRTLEFSINHDGKGAASLASDVAQSSFLLDNTAMIAKGNEILSDTTNGFSITNGSVVLLRKNRLEENGEYGVLSNDPSSAVDARFNWWGHSSGPSGEGSGQGDAVSRYVEFEDWTTEPINVVVSGGQDTLWIPVGESDNLSVYFQNWQERDDEITITSQDDLSWVSGTGSTNATIQDSLGGEGVYPYTVPENTPENTVNIFRFNAVSATNAAWTDSDSVVMVAYAPRLVQLLIAPDTTKVLPGDSIFFSAVALDQHGQHLETEGVAWTAEGGTINEVGSYYAGDTYGTYTVRVRHPESGLEGTAVVVITDDLSDVQVEEPVAGEPVQSIRSRAVPNPFSSKTGIHFVVEQRSSVSLEVYDGRGHKVTTLLNTTLQPDTYELRWEPQDLPSGVYLYRLHVGDTMSSGQLVLTR